MIRRENETTLVFPIFISKRESLRYIYEGVIILIDGKNKTFIKKRPIVGEMAGLTASKSATGDLGDVTVDDATMVMCHFKNGALGTFEATRFATGRKNGMSFEINGSKGSVKFEFQSMNELQYYNNEDDEYTHGFKTIQVTNLAVVENSTDNKLTFQVINRNNGKSS
jgi:predicted dehydrogenase